MRADPVTFVCPIHGLNALLLSTRRHASLPDLLAARERTASNRGVRESWRGKGSTKQKSEGMTLTKDVFFRSHIVELNKKPGFTTTYNEPAWTEYLLLYDTETRVDAEQLLTFGFYRVCRLNGEGNYECVEEGIVHAENLSAS